MRLDFNHDGKVSIEDIRKGIHELYEFMKNFDFFNTAMEIKSTIYNEALRMMKKDTKKGAEKGEKDKREDKTEEDESFEQEDENSLEEEEEEN